MITGLTMGAGNVRVLYKTLESLSTVCDEIIYGDMLLFEDDREILESYKRFFNLKIIKYDFNFIFKNGFSAILNSLADHAKNNITLYLNTSEIIEEDYGIIDAVVNNPECNSFYFVHKIDPHRWYRMGDRRDLKWSGILHEQLSGEYKPYRKPVFCMADLPKDSDNPFKSNVFDCLKECIYFEQYVRIVDAPSLLGETDHGWLDFAKKDYDSFKRRLEDRKEMYGSLKKGDWEGFKKSCWDLKANMSFNSSQAIEYQNNEKYLGK